jgi:DNA-binding transcriptional LysR family regulator
MIPPPQPCLPLYSELPKVNPNMELRHIRYFLEIAETLNFSRAAERLKVAQPALSKQLRDLEAELGGKLFHRTTAKVALTEIGEYFRQQTRKILMQLDIAVTGAQQLAKGASGTLRIGCDWRVPGLPIAPAASRFRATNPRVALDFVEVPSHEHVASVRDHSLDIGFVPSVFVGDADDLELRSLFNMKVKVLLPRGHRLASQPSLTLRELKEEHWLTVDSESLPGARVIMSQILRFTPKFATMKTSMAGMVAHVAAGHGIGLFPYYWESQQIDDSVVAVDTDCTPIEVFAISLKAPTSPLVESYLEIFEEMIRTPRKPVSIPTTGRRSSRPAY